LSYLRIRKSSFYFSYLSRTRDIWMSGDYSSLSFVSWASNVTKCSNHVFNGVLSRSWTNLSMQHDALTVLTGITSLIHEKGGKESSADRLTTVYSLFIAQSRDAWSTESVRQVYRYILGFVDNDKPAVRKASHTAVSDILVGNVEADDEDHLCSALRREARWVCL
uniref:Adaptin_N domain-containing protein n=1 Tax=Echinostoma caproni TaxID=27848 RepID=A0A183A1X8_9TREM